MALLYDAQGREIYEGGVTHDNIRDAIQAAALADDWRLAAEIADRYGWQYVCLKCAIEQATAHFNNSWRVCAACFEKLGSLTFSDTKLYLNGLIKRSVV